MQKQFTENAPGLKADSGSRPYWTWKLCGRRPDDQPLCVNLDHKAGPFSSKGELLTQQQCSTLGWRWGSVELSLGPQVSAQLPPLGPALDTGLQTSAHCSAWPESGVGAVTGQSLWELAGSHHTGLGIGVPHFMPHLTSRELPDCAIHPATRPLLQAGDFPPRRPVSLGLSPFFQNSAHLGSLLRL